MKNFNRTMSWTAALSECDTYTQNIWSGSGTIKVCSLETGSPSSAHILVFATGQEMLRCNINETPTLTAPPVAGPSESGCQDEPDKLSLTMDE